MKLKHPRPYKTAADLKKAELKARLNIEKKLDQQYGRKPLTYEEILEKAYTIKSFQNTPSGPVPTAAFLVLGADRFKDDPEELYNYYLLEIKPLLGAPAKTPHTDTTDSGTSVETENLKQP